MRKNKWQLWALIALLAMFIAACSKEEPDKTAVSPPPAPAAVESVRSLDPALLARGAQLFGEHCALCHGPRAQGHPDWQTPGDGSFAAAPPLDGTGNDWKRSRAQLAHTIMQGAQGKDGAEIMPAWKGRLSERDVDAVVAWLQSLWAPDVYDKWLKGQTPAAVPPPAAPP